MTTPRGAPELVSGQAVPETTVNEQIRRTEAGAARYPVADRVTAPPGSCADGATYLIIATATGAFAGKENQLATAVGANAASGWYYRTLGTIDEGALAYVQDEDAEYKWSGAAWATYSGSGYAPGGTDVAVADGGTGASTASGARANLSAAALTQTGECIAGFIASPSDKTYKLVVKAPHGGTITETTTISVSGTCTATFKINTTALGGTANSVSSGEQSQSHASTNTFSAGDDIQLTVSSNSSCTDMSFSIKYTRTLD